MLILGRIFGRRGPRTKKDWPFVGGYAKVVYIDVKTEYGRRVKSGAVLRIASVYGSGSSYGSEMELIDDTTEPAHRVRVTRDAVDHATGAAYLKQRKALAQEAGRAAGLALRPVSAGVGGMTDRQAYDLAGKLQGTVSGREGRREMRAKIEADRMVFVGGRQGAESVSYPTSSAEKVIAQWDGYLARNGYVLTPGTTVTFPSKTAKTGLRNGVVLESTGARVKVKYRFDYGREATTWVPKKDLVVWAKGSQ